MRSTSGNRMFDRADQIYLIEVVSLPSTTTTTTDISGWLMVRDSSNKRPAFIRPRSQCIPPWRPDPGEEDARENARVCVQGFYVVRRDKLVSSQPGAYC